MLVTLTVVSFVASTVLLFLRRWHRKSTANIFQEIRRRLPPDTNQLGQDLLVDLKSNESIHAL